MTTNPCARLWEVEAERDGRLSGGDLASALRHRALCAECSSEQRKLDQLGARLRALPAPPVDALTLRRTRQRLLASWNRGVIERAPSPTRRTAWALALGGALALAVLLLALSRRHAGESFVTVNAQPGAHWTERRTPEAYHVALRDGVAWFSVRSAREQPVFIDLPDGTIEDRGTVFEVEVRANHTERVAVREGRVRVRLNGQPSFELSAGQTWNAPAPAPPTVEPRAVPPAPSAATSVPRVARRNPPSVLAPSVAPSARAFDSAEDDAYLRIVDLLRNGHSAEAHAQAEQYLARFPKGFRRPEVAAIAARTSLTTH